MMSPTVIVFAAIGLVLGTIAFVISGLMGQPDDASTTQTILAAVMLGGPISAVLGTATGFIWQAILGPLGSGRRRSSVEPETDGNESEEPLRASQSPSPRRYRGKGGGKRKRRW